MTREQFMESDEIEIEARLQQLIDAWVDDTEPSRLKIRRHQEHSARNKIDRWLEQRSLEAELDDQYFVDRKGARARSRPFRH